MPDPDDRSLVIRGWEHLKAQRPLAAWAAWQRVLRRNPDNSAARQALETLATAEELPAAARAAYRFQTPDDETRRARWDARLRGQGLDDLTTASGAFRELASADPTDAVALLNLALCQAWLGDNADAIATLDGAVGRLAGADPGRAAEAWTLAEVLRLGGGAEPLADDFRHVWVVNPADPAALSDGLFDRWPNLRPVETPRDPLTGNAPLEGAQVYDWLDRPWPTPGVGPPSRTLPRVIATVVRVPGSLRLLSPDPTGFGLLEDPPYAEAAALLADARHEASPLPLAWADAAIGTFRFPAELEPGRKLALAREAVEHYFEDLWVHRPRNALDGRSPLAAGSAGPALRAKLEGVVRFREQLGSRPTHANLYQGYPFDRLRRRLGLIGPDDSQNLDPVDYSCMSRAELDAVDPGGLEGPRLADALASACGLGHDPTTVRFAQPFLAASAPGSGFEGLDPEAVVAPLVRRELASGRVSGALEVLARAIESAGDDRTRRIFQVWSAEALTRAGRPDEAVACYRAALDRLGPSAGGLTAYDAAETLLDAGESDRALAFLREAVTRAEAAGDRFLAGRAADRLEQLMI